MNKHEFVIFTSLCHQLKEFYGISFTEFIPKDELDSFLRITQQQEYSKLTKEETAQILKEILEDISNRYLKS
jgi:hypothetical protein